MVYQQGQQQLIFSSRLPFPLAIKINFARNPFCQRENTVDEEVKTLLVESFKGKIDNGQFEERERVFKLDL